MNLSNDQQEVKDFTLKLVNAGSNYRVSELKDIYAKDFSISMLLPDSSIQSMNYDETIDMFTQRSEAGVAPLSEAATINHIDVVGDKAYVIITRVMDFVGVGKEQTIIFHLMLNRSASDQWQVYREHATLSF
ncbi:hypothetical protein OFY17_12110 [Marinomonas sp. C2222]|uniref:DUF4440 domain-containing protein n=1 Tax=Marinomonas sargassi TaxID=2984494 RepID=A0ABT2YUQ6_9GAMM|nr:hypothetical protein [Marinomonas sargassi]MCV2403616.1 hypothetical protein [Marinomonas sargassi]